MRRRVAVPTHPCGSNELFGSSCSKAFPSSRWLSCWWARLFGPWLLWWWDPYNTEACLWWDFGDCWVARHHPVTNRQHHHGTCPFIVVLQATGYSCKDPLVSQQPETPINCAINDEGLLGDGNCDGGNHNTEDCAWYFGGCCELTCGNVGWYTPTPCSNSGFTCLDPSVPQHLDIPIDCIVDNESLLGDSNCKGDVYNTSLSYQWDFDACCMLLWKWCLIPTIQVVQQ